MKILNYSEYRIQQALWLQQSIQKGRAFDENAEQYYLRQYGYYLMICGIKEEDTYPILEISSKLNKYTSRGDEHPYYDNEVANNINNIIDNIVKDLIKTK